ncbi:hypothetical protein TNCV_826341 [Trichonephila clavipes]|nr:hypothetical protein TNCV_826341 [Trichonephila clavipes]
MLAKSAVTKSSRWCGEEFWKVKRQLRYVSRQLIGGREQCSNSVYAHQQKRERNKRNNFGCSFAEAEKSASTFQCGDRAWLTSEHVVLLTAILHPQIGRKIDPKSCIKIVRLIRLLVEM